MSGLEISTVGLILMIAGVLGLVISLLYMTLWSRGHAAPGDRVTVRDRGVY